MTLSLRESDGFGINRYLLQPSHRIRQVAGLISATEVLGKESFFRQMHGEVVDRARETVTLMGKAEGHS
jgi:hypothetical protein